MSSIDDKILEIDRKYAAYMSEKLEKGKINDPEVIAFKTIEYLEQEPFSPRNFRDIEWHSNF